MSTIEIHTIERAEEVTEAVTEEESLSGLAALRIRREEVARALREEEEAGPRALQAAVAGTGGLDALIEREGRLQGLRAVARQLDQQVEEAMAAEAIEEARIERAELVKRLAALADEGNRAIAEYVGICDEAGAVLQSLLERASAAHGRILHFKAEFIRVASRTVPEVGRSEVVLRRTDKLSVACALTNEVEKSVSLTALGLPHGSPMACSFERFVVPQGVPLPKAGFPEVFQNIFYQRRSELAAEQSQRLAYELTKR